VTSDNLVTSASHALLVETTTMEGTQMPYEVCAEAEAAIEAIGRELFEEVRGWRQHLHAHPELGFEEHGTAAFIRGLLDEWGVPFDPITPTGTIASLTGGRPGPVLMVRADIDALPVREHNDLPFASRNDGVMHACGHDGHTAIVLGLVKYLATRQDSFAGEIRFLFQPAEETVEQGALDIIAAGGLEGVSLVVGLHIMPQFPTGQIALSDGPLMATDDRFDITIEGRGGHVLAPHETVDVVVIAAGLVGQLQTLTSRRVDPMIAATLGIGSLHAGDIYNVIPGTATLSGTVRTLSPEVRSLLAAELVAMTEGFAEMHGAKASVTYRFGSPPLINDAAAVDFARSAAAAAVGESGVFPMHPMLGSEDFANYGEHAPIVFAFLGAGDGSNRQLHHEGFDFDEAALAIGLKYFVGISEQWGQEAADSLT
jgi:amidohydrolase